MNNNNYQYYPLQDEDHTTNTNNINNTLIWLDEETLNLTSPNTRLTIDMFKSVANTDYKLYNNSELFLEEIENMTKTTRIIVIMSGWFAKKLLPDLSVSLLREISSIIIFCQDSKNYQYLLKKYRKVIDICTDEQSLKETIQDELNPSTNFLVMDQDLNPLFILKDNNQEFNLYKQYIEILKYYPWTSKNRKKMIDECLKYYRKNTAQREKIEEFKYSYTPETAIQWYTRDSFLYRLVNKALRLLDMDQINIFRPYIRDLCAQLEHLHEQNRSNKPLIVFRGHGNMNIDHFETIKRNIGGLISFNGFLSTTTDYQVALIYAGSSSNLNKSVLFEIRTNFNSKSVVFADISHLSDMQDEQEVLFNLCSIFRIDDITDDIDNQLSKIIMSTTDEGTVIIERKHRLSCINQYYRKQNIIKAFAAILFIAIMTLGVIFGINIKLKDQNQSSYNCVGPNCTTTALTKMPSTVTTNLTKTISTTPEYGTTSATVSTREDCIPVGWNHEGDIVSSDATCCALAVDDDLNVYVTSFYHKSLDKWSPQGTLTTRLYAGEFNTRSPLFFHSPSKYLYFCLILNESLGIFKITNENLMPINVIENINPELRMEHKIFFNCNGLYVNTAGDIFMLDRSTNVVRKWTVNSSSSIVVANGNKTDSVRYPNSFPTDFAIDEPNNIIYLLDTPCKRILKYINGSESGITIVDGLPVQMFVSKMVADIDPTAIAYDKTGYIVLGERDRITIWSSDGKFNVIAIKEYQVNQSNITEKIQPGKMAFDRLGNLYALVPPYHIIKFNRTSSTCKNNVVIAVAKVSVQTSERTTD